ncbi:MAG TPA: GNAT family N-acetyltransferase [Stellaceae bacterium]|nr:GNAT family N-acetyltransferase [Stellaceae bacterium]
MADAVSIRPAKPSDGPALMRVVAQIDAETEFLGVPGQPHPWAERPEAELRSLAENERGVVLLAVTGRGEIVGYLSGFLGHFTRNRGNLFIAVVGLREAYRGQGIGTLLFEAVEEWALAHRAWRIELRVSSLNERGQALYRKRGFEIEGRIRSGVFRRGAWTDDFWMAKLLAPILGRPLAAVPPDTARRAAVPSAAPTPSLREMRPGDGAAFRAWDMSMSEAVPHALKLPREVASAEAIERDIRHNPSDPRFWLVATVPAPGGAEAIVGFASGNIEYGFRMQHDAFINVAVLPKWRGQGLAKRLHDRVETWALDRGVRRLTATAQAPNLEGRAFAAAIGYETEVTMRSYSLINGRMVDRLRLGKLFAA